MPTDTVRIAANTTLNGSLAEITSMAGRIGGTRHGTISVSSLGS
jgi:hypothetical protein